MQTAVGILPTMIGMLTAVYMLRASGAINLASAWLAPLFHLLGIPQECVPLALLKPISGGGGLALGSELIRTAYRCRTIYAVATQHADRAEWRRSTGPADLP